MKNSAKQAIMAMQRASEAAALSGVSDMSLEEINDEIQAVRREQDSETVKVVIPISRFHKGEVEKIFEEVETAGTGFVVEEGKCICVLLSPERYDLIMEMIA